MSDVALRQSAAQELLARRSATDSLSGFRTYMARTGSVDFQHPPARHHQLIISHLERLERGAIQRLMILAPPGSAKSTYCSIQFPLWRLARQPNRNILCASNTQDLASGFNRRRRNLALTPEWATLAGTSLAEDLQGAEHFGTKREGGIKAAGVGSAIVGFRSHLNVLDDPIRGQEEALSATTLEKQWDWFHNEFRTRLVPGAPELIVSTRWAKNDIAGRLLASEGERWTVLRLPMECDRDDDPLGRAVGESLWPEYFTPAHIAEKKANPLLWSTQFQQVPLDASGSWIGNENIVYEQRTPDDVYYVIAVDLALSVGRGDYTAIVVAGLDAQRKLHVIDVYRERVDPKESALKFLTLCTEYQPKAALIDDDNAAKVWSRYVLEYGRSRGWTPPPLTMIPMRGRDKETRAAAIRGLFLSDDVRIQKAPWNGALHRELMEFPSGDHDDQVDALGLIGRRYAALPSPVSTERPRERPSLKLIETDSAGRQFYGAPLDEMWKDHETRIARMRRPW